MKNSFLVIVLKTYRYPSINWTY